MKVEQQGHSVRRDQDIRRLHIPVDKVPEMGVVKRLRQAEPDPDDRPLV